jgi:hypothetical protein
LPLLAVTGIAVVAALTGGIAAATNAGPHVAHLAAADPPTAPASFVGITPVRVLDTRASAPIGQGATINVTAAGVHGIPSFATSIAATVAVTGATTFSYITVWPTGQPRPMTSTGYGTPGQSTASGGSFELGTNHQLSIFHSAGKANVILDVTGYYVPANPTITTNALTYTTGATVTYTGTAWNGCTLVKIDVFGQGGFTVANNVTPTAGGFTGTFTAGAPGEYLLNADSPAGPPQCHAFTMFTVTP